MPVPTSNIEDVFHRINKFTTLKSCCDKSITTHNFDYVRDYILSKMREEDPVFNYLTKGHSLTGSYADNLKVRTPNEFDLLLLIKFKYPPIIVKDETRPGNVKINMSYSLLRYLENPNTHKAANALQEMCNSEGYLLHSELQGWFQRIFAKIKLQGLKLHVDGRRYSLRYSTSGPAHTIHVTTDPVSFSIDLVPAVLLDEGSWCAPRPCPRNASNCYWHAIPKPIYIMNGGVDNSSVSWQGSYANMERAIIDNNCNNLKNTLRILKKFRDRQNYGTFKSYFIKTMYLWECSRQEKKFWDQSIVTIVFYMLEKWREYLENETLPFYWDENSNLLERNSYWTMTNQFKRVLKKMKECRELNPEGILELFLTDDEISQFTPAVNQTNNGESSNNSWLPTIIDAIKGLVVGSIGYTLYRNWNNI